MTGTPTILVDAFFDEPGLLSVRLSRPASSAPVQQFSARRPDTSPGVRKSSGSSGELASMLAIGGIVLAGVVAVGAVVINNAQSSAGPEAMDAPSDGAVSPEAVRVEADNRPTDAGGTTAWASTLDRLADDLQPRRQDLQPFAVRTLLDVPKEIHAQGRDMPGWMPPVASPTDRQARDRAKRLADHLTAGTATEGTAIILDLPGSQSVAAAAGLGRVGDAVFTMDNLPHERGVVPSHTTLGAAIYWRPQILLSRPIQVGTPMPVFVLDANRLNPYDNEPNRFDNRSRARLPSSEAMRALGITTVIYLRPTKANVSELDDVNPTLIAYAAAGITVRPLGLDSVDDLNPPVTGTSTPESSPQTSGSLPWLWYYLMIGRSGHTGYGSASSNATYQATPRAVMPFSSDLDGGERQRSSLFKHLAATSPPKRSPSHGSSGSGSTPSHTPSSGSRPSTGGSWARSFSSSSHSFGG